MRLLSRCVAFAVIFVSGFAAAQVSTGTPAFGSFGGGSFDTVNLGNLNVHFAIPVLHKAGRGVPFQYDLSYDSSVWYPVTINGTTQWQPAANWGWTASTAAYFGYVTVAVATSTTPGPPCTVTETDHFYTYHDPLGKSHPFPGSTYKIQGSCLHPPSTTSGPLVATATDGSGYTINAPYSGTATVTSASGAIVSSPTNTQTGGATYTDANGNQLSVNTSGQYFDTLSGTTPVLTIGGSGPTTLTYTAPSGSNVSYTMNYTQYTVQTNFGVSGVSEYRMSVALVSSITLPDQTSYSFQYEQTPGTCIPLQGTYANNCVTGRLASVTLPTGGTITYTYTGGSSGIFRDGSTSGITRTLSASTVSPAGTWQYARSLLSGTAGPGSTWKTTIEDPASNYTVINFAEDSTTTTGTTAATYNLFETQRVTYQGSISPSNVLSTTVRCYNAVFTNCATATVATPITSIDTYTTPYNGRTRTSEVHYNGSYTGSGLVNDYLEYDYGVTSGAAPPVSPSTYILRETVTSYASLGNGVLNKPSSIVVKDGSGNTVASTSYAYDQGSVTATTGTPQHIAITGSRGNLTTVSQSVSSSATLSSSYTYFDTGLVQTATDVNGAQTTYTYGSPCPNSFPTLVTGPTGLTNQATWDCTGGVVLTATDANGNQTSSLYTDPYFWRPSSSTDAANNATSFTYTPASPGVPQSLESNMAFNSGSSATDRLITFDPHGRTLTTQTRQAPGSSSFDTVTYAYDATGRQTYNSLPYSGSQGQASVSNPGTTTGYDALSRQTSVSDSGGGLTQFGYSQNDQLVTNGPAPSGENAKRRQYEYDGLGRLTSVCEVTSGTGSGTCAQSSTQTGYWTKYTYNALGKMTGVVQNAQAASGSQQTRTFAYDWLGRLTSETNPENGTTTYTYDTNTTCGTSNGDLVKKVDAAGNVTCMVYDLLHRPVTVTYPSGPNSANTSTKNFVYDSATVNGVPMAKAKGRLAEAYTGTSSTKITDLGFSYSVRGETTDVYQKIPSSGGYFHVNAGYWANGVPNLLSANVSAFPTITYGVDGEGRLNSVSGPPGTQNPLQSTNYDAGSRVTGLHYGSLDVDTFGFDPNTGRMTSYNYQIGGQSVVGLLTWNPNGSLGSLAITDPYNSANSQTCTYAHDDLGRAASTNCLAAGTQTPLWYQAFTYDSFGNLTKPSGDSITFAAGYTPTSGQPNNRIQTGIPNVVYDASGNLTSILSDYSHQYSWDANGNQIAVDGITVTYDALDRAAERLISGSYVQVLYSPWSGKRIAQITGGTLVKEYVEMPGGAVAAYVSTGLSTYRHPDWLGSMRFVSTPSRTLYYSGALAPFGESYSETSNHINIFTGQGADTEAGQYDFLYRRYSPVQGRWISPDRAGLGAVDPGSPQSWNRYAYVQNSPLNSTDSTGLMLDNHPGGFGGGGGDGGCFLYDPSCSQPCDPMFSWFCGPGGIGGGDPGGGRAGRGNGIYYDDQSSGREKLLHGRPKLQQSSVLAGRSELCWQQPYAGHNRPSTSTSVARN